MQNIFKKASPQIKELCEIIKTKIFRRRGKGNRPKSLYIYLYLIPMQLYKLANQPIYSRLKVNNWSRHLLYADLISFFVKRNVKKV